jgi:hypothetical protein
VPLGRKVDDVARRCQIAGFEHKHPARLDLLARAGRRIGLEVLRKLILELQCDTAPHHTNAVDGVDQRLGLAAQDVACRVFDHRRIL